MNSRNQSHQDLFKGVLQALDTPIVVVDSDRLVLFMNPAMRKLLFSGGHEEECIGRPLSDALNIDNETCEILAPETWIRSDAPNETSVDSTSDLGGLVHAPVRVHRRVVRTSNQSRAYVIAMEIPEKREQKLREKAVTMQKRHLLAQSLVAKLKHFFARNSHLPADINGHLKGICRILYDMYKPYAVLLNIQLNEKKLYSAGAEIAAAIRGNLLDCSPDSLCASMMSSGLPLYMNSLDATEPYSSQFMINELGLRTYLGAPLRDSKGLIHGTIALVDTAKREYEHVDVELVTVAALQIAARLRAEEQDEIHRELSDRLRQSQKMEAVGMLAGGIAHDFNNILSGILGFSSYMLSKTEPGGDLHRNLGLIEQSAVRGSELTQQLLTFSRKKDVIKESVSMNRVIEESLGILERTLAKNIVIYPELESGLPPILGDHGQMNQVIMNLCLNAADAMADGGGDITLRTECRPLTGREKTILINSTESKYICVMISDSGVGMDEEVRERIFDPFFTTKPGNKGTGLGLSIVYGIVDNHGGHIVASSRKGKGSTFTLYFPLHHEEIYARNDKPPEPARGNETILVVDDEEVVRLLLTEILEGHGYKVITTASGIEAVDYFRENSNSIDLVFLDMIMPEMDGKATFEAIRRIDNSVPVLLTSGYYEEEISRELIEKGALGMVHKPYKSDVLVSRIRNCFERTTASES